MQNLSSRRGFFWGGESLKLSCSWVSRRGFCINLFVPYESQSSSPSCPLCLFKLRPRLCMYEFISFSKIWYPRQESNLPRQVQVQRTTAVCTERQPLLSSAVLEVGVWAVSVARTCSMCALLPHLRRWFMAGPQTSLSLSLSLSLWAVYIYWR